MGRKASRGGCLVAGLAFIALVLAAAPTTALSGSVNVIVSVLPGPYAIGDTVDATIHIYNSLALADPSNISFYIYTGNSPYYPYGRILSASRVSTGLYTAAFQLLSSDIAWGYPSPPNETSLRLQADAQVGGTWDSGVAAILLYSIGFGFEAAVTASARSVAPGQSVTFDTGVYVDGTPADPDTIAGNLWLATAFPNNYGPAPTSVIDSVVPTFSHAATGSYRTTYTVPATLSERAIAMLVVTVSRAGAYASASGRTFVDPGESLVVWYHLAQWGPLNARTEVWVADGHGSPIGGAAVSLTYSVYVPVTPTTIKVVTRSVSSVTNTTGCAVLYLPFPQGFRSLLPFWGNVTSAGRRQAFRGSLGTPSMDYSLGMVRSPGALATYAPGDTVNRTYAFGSSQTSKGIAYYASTDDGWSLIGNAMTDAMGNVTITFTAPSRTVDLTFVDAASNAGFASDTVFVADPSRMTVQGLALGKVAHLAVSLPATDGSVAFVPYDNTSRDPLSGLLSWIPFSWGWALGSGLSTGMDLAASPGPGFSYDLVVPSFLPGGRDYLLMVDVGDPVGSALRPVYPAYYATRFFHLDALPPASPPTSPLPSASSPLGLVLSAAAGGAAGLVAAAVVIMWWRRTERSPPPETPRSEPGPPPRGPA